MPEYEPLRISPKDNTRPHEKNQKSKKNKKNRVLSNDSLLGACCCDIPKTIIKYNIDLLFNVSQIFSNMCKKPYLLIT